ncbi:hypothetical protein JW979_05240 [bacterium]|nr:hypothetical protein [candidate division CSSED10-310 bacterium]
MCQYLYAFHRNLFFFLWMLGLFGSGCSPSIPKIPIKGELAGQHIDTTVDSEIARYYLESYLQNNRTNPSFDLKIDQVNHFPMQTLPDREYLTYLARTYSVDFATLYFMKRISESESDHRIVRSFHEIYSKAKHAGDLNYSTFLPQASAYLFLFAPSWLYKTNPYTGADFAKIRKLLDKLGLHSQLIETEESGAVETNAKIIAQELLRLKCLHKRIILISASKSGPEVAQALGEYLSPDQTSHIKAWMNISGVLQGSQLADSALTWPVSWKVRSHFSSKGWDIAGLESVTSKRSRKRFEHLRFPDHLLIINYLGIPLSGNINKPGWKGYLNLRHGGPNDGRTYLLDAIIPGAITIPQFGFDHYLWDPDLDLKVTALLQTLIQYLEPSTCVR